MTPSNRNPHQLVFLASLLWTLAVPAPSIADPSPTDPGTELADWQRRAVEYARIMSHVTWSPVAETMPARGGYFEKGKEYTGVPYSSVKHVGRYIGFDIFLKTFLAAVENPHSVLYTENLYGEIKNAECYYGKVCSSYTSYALQCGFWYLSYHHTPENRDGVTIIEPETAQNARVGDIIFTPPRPGSHVEIVTDVTRDSSGNVTHVRVEESRPQTTRETYRTAEDFETHLSDKNRQLLRITDFEAWRSSNKAESLLFPNYAEDSTHPQINRVLLLDRGDWVPYYRDQAVKFHIMDRDDQGVESLVIKRGDETVEEIQNPGKGVIERAYSICGDYTAHCLLRDGTSSQACEFSVCDIDFELPNEPVTLGQPWELKFTTDNMQAAIVYLQSLDDRNGRHILLVSEEDRRNQRITIPRDLLIAKGGTQIWLLGENQYGRLKSLQEFVVK